MFILLITIPDAFDAIKHLIILKISISFIGKSLIKKMQYETLPAVGKKWNKIQYIIPINNPSTFWD